ncbi:hypothetical protein [uncultured Chloroflexus sp.]|uniref:hypothetical protein n=1 Tax=uncultured Chloroflexus sp. TaxID=214040 RepID=UPI002608B68E|nr:hypothetical protein [uncultured Chloroflexus sp.]
MGTQPAKLRPDRFVALGLAILGIVCAGLASLLPPAGRLDIGTTYAQPYIDGFYGLERNRQFSYSFTKTKASVSFPGIGSNWTTVVLRANGYRPDGAPPAELVIATETLQPVQVILRSDTARYYLLVPPGDDNLRLQLTSSTFSTATDPRQLGVAIDWIEAYQLEYGWPFWQAVHFTLIGVLGYWLARRVAVAPLPAAALVSTVLITLGGLLAVYRIWWAIFTPVLWGLLAGLHLALGPLRAFTRFAFARGGETLPPPYETWIWRIVLLAALIKIGGVIYPQTIVYDERWHVPRTQMVLDGRFIELVVPSRVTLLGDTVGFEGGHFPYSPLWYLITAPFGLVGIDLGLASNVLNTALDVSRSLLIAYIALRLFGRPVIAVVAAGCYHLLLMPYFLISWGNWPTQLGLWGALVLIAVVLAYYDHPTDRRALWGVAAAAALAILTYTVVGIMAFTMMGIYALIELIRRESHTTQRGRLTLIGLVIAEAAAFLIYHIWYVPVVVAETVPVIASALARRASRAEALPLPTPAIDGAFMLNHLTWVGIGLILGGAVLAWFTARRAHSLLISWWAILILYSLVNWTIADMILKHVFFMLPLAAICMALALDWLWKQGIMGRAVTGLSLLYLVMSVAVRWYHFIMEKRHIV